MKGVHDMNFEKIKWWCKAQKKIKDGVRFYFYVEQEHQNWYNTTKISLVSGMSRATLNCRFWAI